MSDWGTGKADAAADDWGTGKTNDAADDWGTGKTDAAADQWGNGGESHDSGANGADDNFGVTKFDDAAQFGGDDGAQFGGETAGGFGDDSAAADTGRTHGGGDHGCYNCGEEGFVSTVLMFLWITRLTMTIISHNKADCPNPRVEREFTGTCHVCEKEGHMAKDCPDKPPQVCRNCHEEGEPQCS